MKGTAMAEPARAVIPLEGKAARDFLRYMKTSKPDPRKLERLKEAAKTHARIINLDATPE